MVRAIECAQGDVAADISNAIAERVWLDTVESSGTRAFDGTSDDPRENVRRSKPSHVALLTISNNDAQTPPWSKLAFGSQPTIVDELGLTFARLPVT